MTRQILIVIYVLMVLALSGAVKAEEVAFPLPIGHGIIRNVDLDENRGVINIHGILPTPCHTKPAVVIDKIDESNQTIFLDVVTMAPSAPCVDSVGASFDAALDLKELPLENEKTYAVVFKTLDHQAVQVWHYTAHAHLGGFVQQSFDKKALKGLLVYFSNPTRAHSVKSYALRDGAQVLPIAHSEIDFGRFQNRSVHMSGYLVDNEVVPVSVISR